MNQDLANLVQWLRANKISLNASKTEIILFKNQRKNITKNLNFRLSGQKIKLSSHVKYLGLILDENLTWDKQMHNLTLKFILAKLCHYLDYKTILSVYYALFDSHINYFLPNLGYTTVENLNKIELLQKKALRIIHFKSNMDTCKPLFVKSRILPINKQVALKNCLFAYDFLHNRLPSYFRNFLQKSGENHNHATRASTNCLDITRTNSNSVRYGTYNLANLISKNWNNFYAKVKVDYQQVSKPTFKHHLHSFILTELAST